MGGPPTTGPDWRRIGRGLAVLAVAAGLAACARAKSFDYTAGSEIPPGPDLFSGKKGAFILYRSGSAEAEPDEAKPADE